MPTVVDERPAAPAAPAAPAGACRGTQRRRRYAGLLRALALAALASTAALAVTADGVRPATATAPAAGPPAAAPGSGAGVASVLLATGRVRAGARVPAINGIARGMGSLWLTGGEPGNNHVLFRVNPVTGTVDARVYLPSRIVLNPNDIAVGSGAVWVAVGASVYRIAAGQARAGTRVRHAFAVLPGDGLVGDLVVGSGSVWVTDTVRGAVYRFAVRTGRLEAVVKVGVTASALAVGDGGVWAADDDAHTVSRISVARDRVDSVVTVPGAPSQMAVAGDRLWVTDGTGSVVAVAADGSHRPLIVHVGGAATGIATAGGTVWVANTAKGALDSIDARRHLIVDTVPIGVRPYAVAAGQGTVWVALLGRPVPMVAPPAASPSSPGGVLSHLPVGLCGVR